MKRPADLLDTFVFDRGDLSEPSSPTSLKVQGAYAFASRPETDLGDAAVEIAFVDTSKEETEALSAAVDEEKLVVLRWEQQSSQRAATEAALSARREAQAALEEASPWPSV